MPKLTIDGRQATVPDGATILDTAESVGIEIPTLCFLKPYRPQNTCMVCLVKVNGSDRLTPACSTEAADGMVVESEVEEVRDARRTALELTLSDHTGDCQAPCRFVCPAHMDIPRMIQQIGEGRIREALITVKRDIALPAVLGRICPAPCEAGCRRKQAGGPVGVCMLKRFVADVDLDSPQPYNPTHRPRTGKSVAVIGAGPTGLAAAYYLQSWGYDCTVYDEHDLPGGMLRYAVPEDVLPRSVLEGEIESIFRLGVRFTPNVRTSTRAQLENLLVRFDCVAFCAGRLTTDEITALGLQASIRGIQIDDATYQTSLPNVFAAGAAIRPSKLAVRSVADGKAVARSIQRYLSGLPALRSERAYHIQTGQLPLEELQKHPAADIEAQHADEELGYSSLMAMVEARRCLQCGCLAASTCRLRQASDRYGAKPSRFNGSRRPAPVIRRMGGVCFDAGKCIACGLCVEIARRRFEPLGVSFIGRGFNIELAAPFSSDLTEGLGRSAAECVAACPTGALSDSSDLNGE
jgi:ferredoxin